MWIRISRWVPSLLFLAGIGAGCGSSDSSDPPLPPIIADRAFGITGKQADGVIVEANRLTFPLAGNEDLLKKLPGDVLVGDRQTTTGGKNPMGFIRKVKTVTQQGAQIVIDTDPAAITDAIKRGHASTQVTFPATTTKGFLGPKDTGGLAGGQVDVTGKVLDMGAVGAKASISQGHLAFNPKMDIGFDIDWFKIKEFHAIAGGTLDVGLAVELAASVAAMTNVTIPVFEAPPYPLPPQMIGPIPVVETLNFSVKLICELQDKGEVSVNVGASANTSLSVGVRYQNGGWSKVAEESFSWTPIGPDLKGKVGVELKCILQPELALMFYDVAGPYVNFGPYASFGLTVPPCEWEIKAGIEGNAGGKVEVLDFTLAQLELKLFDKSWSLLKGSCDEKDAGPDSPAGTDGGADATPGDASCNLGITPTTGWTCAAAKFGDCICDCNCGDPDPDCTVTGQCADCSHDVCTTGGALKPSCDSCTAAICAVDTYCCDYKWSGSCTMEVATYCGKTCS